ncbi:MAG: response regulator transcription factor [Oleispira sp.]|nr:response regulator transcription factor [Oleispira sp.]MBL4880720.1 response regulator transcription factor [Oleispira sp.]
MKILHLDDHTMFAEGLNVVVSLHADDLSIVGASSVEGAWQVLEQQPDIELILIDLNIPGLNGLDFIESLFERNFYIPFIVLSASSDLFQIRSALNNGASGFIPKTYSITQILQVIEQVLAGDIVVPKDIEQAIAYLPEHEPSQNHYKTMTNYNLGQRQMDVLKLMQEGHSNNEIAERLNLSKNTIKTHVKTLFSAFQVSNRIECVRYAERIELI